MAFERNRLPEPATYFEEQGLILTGRGPWRTTSCAFHGGSDSMRLHIISGGWCCMACGAKGGDVLSYHMQVHGLEFIEAAKALGAWVDDGRPAAKQRPSPLTPRQALQVLGTEANLAAIAAANVAQGVVLSDQDLSRLMTASGRITRIMEVFA